MSLPAVFADFNGFDREGHLWLHFAQTAVDVRSHGPVMAEGLRLIASDHDLAAAIVVRADPKGGRRGRIVSELFCRT